MAYQLNDLGSALTAQIYHSIMGGDGKVQPPKNTFFTWCMPGLPFSEADLDFCAKGIYSASTADDMKARLGHAFSLAMLMDFIPDAGAPYSSERQEGMYKPDAERRLSETYRQILRFAKVVNNDLTDSEKKKIQQFRDLLFATRKVKDLITDEEMEVTEETPMLRAYNDKMATYLSAVLEYNAKRIAAAAATGPEGKGAVADWSTNADTYFLKVKAAASAWEAGGHRTDVDRMNAYISQVSGRSMLMWQQNLVEAYDKGAVTGTDVSIPFRYTTLVPGNLATAGGWTGLGVTHDHVKWARDNQTTSWQAGGGLSFGLFTIGGGASGSKTEVNENVAIESFLMTFDMCQALIVRPWFFPEWFACRGWTLRKGEGWTFDDMPSDGKSPPKGLFIGYATQAVFVRNVNIRSAEFVSAYNKIMSSLSARASIGWGPFSLGGSYGHAETHERFESTQDGQWLRVPGMQIIGFVNHLIGKAPNPLPELKDGDFV